VCFGLGTDKSVYLGQQKNRHCWNCIWNVDES